jgi:hypothetical protein
MTIKRREKAFRTARRHRELVLTAAMKRRGIGMASPATSRAPARGASSLAQRELFHTSSPRP